MNGDKQHAQELLNRLAPDQIAALAHLMEVMLEPASHSLDHTPIEDEQISEEEARAVERSREWFKNHDGIPFERVVADLGFTMDQIRDRGPDEEQKDSAA